jgi:hypothetical protein
VVEVAIYGVVVVALMMAVVVALVVALVVVMVGDGWVHGYFHMHTNIGKWSMHTHLVY